MYTRRPTVGMDTSLAVLVESWAESHVSTQEGAQLRYCTCTALLLVMMMSFSMVQYQHVRPYIDDSIDHYSSSY